MSTDQPVPSSAPTKRHPVRAVVGVGLLVLGIGVMARSCASGPTDSITSSGTYEVGDDIVAGYWAAAKPTGARRSGLCTFSVWVGDYQLVSGMEAAAVGGISLKDGQTLITSDCGVWSRAGAK